MPVEAMSSGEADAVRDPESVPHSHHWVAAYPAAPRPNFAMAAHGFTRAQEFVGWQLRTFGYVLRCGWCKNAIEDRIGEGGILRQAHIEGASHCREVLPFRANR
jgi:hypothetical protein